jgi:chemotaxis response regulator CheB
MRVKPASFLGCIGASTGGPSALKRLVMAVPDDFLGALIVVQHIGDDFVDSLVDWLREGTGLRCVLAEDGDRPTAGSLYLAPGGQQLVLDSGGYLRLVMADEGQVHTPSIDRFFESVAASQQAQGLGVLLSGMGEDGARGLLRLRESGFSTVTQSADTCVVYGMPRAAVALGASQQALAPSEIGAMIGTYSLANRRFQGRPGWNRRALIELAGQRANQLRKEATKK